MYIFRTLSKKLLRLSHTVWQSKLMQIRIQHLAGNSPVSLISIGPKQQLRLLDRMSELRNINESVKEAASMRQHAALMSSLEG